MRQIIFEPNLVSLRGPSGKRGRGRPRLSWAEFLYAQALALEHQDHTELQRKLWERSGLEWKIFVNKIYPLQ